MEVIVVTPDVSHAPMSSLKDAAAVLQELDEELDAQNKVYMSVTLPVSHVEMWPYVASAAALFESHAATAGLMVLSDIRHCLTPHDVDAHGVL